MPRAKLCKKLRESLRKHPPTVRHAQFFEVCRLLGNPHTNFVDRTIDNADSVIPEVVVKVHKHFEMQTDEDMVNVLFIQDCTGKNAGKTEVNIIHNHKGSTPPFQTYDFHQGKPDDKIATNKAVDLIMQFFLRNAEWYARFDEALNRAEFNLSQAISELNKHYEVGVER